ncbi:MAG: hypothetical protein RR145_03650 [Oscillospiraceae bacterium]
MVPRKAKNDASEWKVEIHYVDYLTGEEIDISKFTKEERARRQKIIMDSAFAKIGYFPVEASK